MFEGKAGTHLIFRSFTNRPGFEPGALVLARGHPFGYSRALHASQKESTATSAATMSLSVDERQRLKHPDCCGHSPSSGNMLPTRASSAASVMGGSGGGGGIASGGWSAGSADAAAPELAATCKVTVQNTPGKKKHPVEGGRVV